jgi:A/G-specific adenine glycosylase
VEAIAPARDHARQGNLIITKKGDKAKIPDQMSNPTPLDLRKKNRLRRKLLAWYFLRRRDLPWRRAKDPYAVWISEVMLQQTQVRTVIPYYLRFLKAFPTIEDLARADQQELLRVWAGLGYYARARNLQLAAREIIRSHGGRFPRDYSDLVSLPGIGRYTAGAILSIAFDLRYPVLDGNVTRVLTRLFSLRGDPKRKPLQFELWRTAQELLPHQHSGDFNQAVMELGAVVCSPGQPRCLLCPWRTECRARKEGIEKLLPEKPKAAAGKKVQWAIAVLTHRGRVLVVKRTQGSLLRDFWEFPGGEFSRTQPLRPALAKQVFKDLGLRIRPLEPLATIKHTITNRRITLVAFEAELEGKVGTLPKTAAAKWVRRAELKKYPLASASQKILQILQAPTRIGVSGRARLRLRAY